MALAALGTLGNPPGPGVAIAHADPDSFRNSAFGFQHVLAARSGIHHRAAEGGVVAGDSGAGDRNSVEFGAVRDGRAVVWRDERGGVRAVWVCVDERKIFAARGNGAASA